VAGSRPSQPAVLGNALLFRADAGSAGDELYVTDGTAAGTRLVRDIWPGATGSKPTELVTAGKRVFFSAATASAGRELWVSDGTAAGTKLVKDIWPGAAGSEPHHVSAVGDAVFFSAWDGSHGFELWRSDGTDVGTKMVADSLVATSEPTGAASGGAPTLLTPFDGGLSYAVGYVDQNQNSGRFAMRTDAGGGPPWTFGYRTLDPGLSPHHPGDIAAAGPTLFMHDGTLLMRSDGTTENWTAFYDNEVNLAGPFAITGDAALFAAAADDGLGRELWRLGTNGVPRRVADIAPGSDSSAPQDITPWGGGAAFGARTSDVGTELWRTDGTSVMRVADIRPGPAGSDPGRLTAVGSDLVFTADDGQHGDELWRTTGTAEGTHMLADVAPGARSSAITWIRRVGNRLVFDADDGASGSELWSIALPLPEPPAPPPPSDGGGTSSPPASSSEPALLGASSQPPQTPPAAVETLPARTPAGPAADRVAPRLSRLTLMRRRGRAYLSFRLSEPARVKVIAQRRVRGHWRTLRFDFSRRGARGRNRIGITPLVRAARRPARLMVSATDSAGNRSRVLVVRVS
jgi:ELWxxDGT repeat protein